jgi:hypothetical protein
MKAKGEPSHIWMQYFAVWRSRTASDISASFPHTTTLRTGLDIDLFKLICACHMPRNRFDDALWSGYIKEISPDCPIMCTKTGRIKLTQYSRHLKELLLDSLQNKAISVLTDGLTQGGKT